MPTIDEAIENVARILAPDRWAVMDSYLRQAKKQYAKSNAGYDPEAFKDRQSIALAKAALSAFYADVPVSEAVCESGALALIDAQKEHGEDPMEWDDASDEHKAACLDTLAKTFKNMCRQHAEEIQ